VKLRSYKIIAQSANYFVPDMPWQLSAVQQYGVYFLPQEYFHPAMVQSSATAHPAPHNGQPALFAAADEYHTQSHQSPRVHTPARPAQTPASGFSNPRRIFMVVVLPAPLRPKKPNIDPAGTSKSTPRSPVKR
jgi:hypothetical protein